MAPHLLVEPLADDIVTLSHCMVMDALAFPRPGFLAARDLQRTGFRAWTCRSTDEPTPWGFLGVQRHREALHVTVVTTYPQHRRKGVATALLRTAIVQARQARLARLTLEVRPDNAAAIALYEKLGFVAGNLIADYYAPGEDALNMVLRLASPKPRLRTR